MSFTRDGFGTDVSVKTLKLTGNAAKQLTHKLGLGKSAKGASASFRRLSVFKGGQVMGCFLEHDPAEHGDAHSRRAARSLAPTPKTLGDIPRDGVNPFTGITPVAPATEVGGTGVHLPDRRGERRTDRHCRHREQCRWRSRQNQIVGERRIPYQFGNLSLDFAQTRR